MDVRWAPLGQNNLEFEERWQTIRRQEDKKEKREKKKEKKERKERKQEEEKKGEKEEEASSSIVSDLGGSRTGSYTLQEVRDLSSLVISLFGAMEMAFG